MTTAVTVLATLEAYPALGDIAVLVLGIGIGAMLAALVAWVVRP